jgi:membrane-bound lytic murein transglycosylase D
LVNWKSRPQGGFFIFCPKHFFLYSFVLISSYSSLIQNVLSLRSFAHMRGTLLIVWCILTSIWATAQNSFMAQTEKMLYASEHQWLCNELDSAHHRYFHHTDVKLPADWSLTSARSFLPEWDLVLTDADIMRFEELYFPGGDMKSPRFLKLKALTDLYFPLFDKALMAQSLPREYKFLALALSGLNQHFSSETDRCGLWALDFLVARKAHLRIDEYVDERRGGDFTTNAAVAYLKELHTLFGGDKTLVVLAYAQSVAGAKSAQSNGISWHQLSEEQRDLVAFVQYSTALFSAVSTTHQLNTCFDILGQYESIWFEKDTQLDALVDVLKQDLKTLHNTNPVYTGDVVQANYRRVPYVLDKRVAANFKTLKDSVYNWMPKAAPAVVVAKTNEIYHTVRKGESLGTIARKYHVSVKQLKSWNRLRKDNINAGQKLRIVRTTTVENEPAVAKTENKTKPNNATPKPEKSTENNKPKENPNPKDKGQKQIIYKVKSGDSLWKIARKYNVTEQQIQKWNKCGERLRPGQKLKILVKD